MSHEDPKVKQSDARTSDVEKDSAVSEKSVLVTGDSREAERKILLKLDLIIVPLTALLYVSLCIVIVPSTMY
jgi:hypothetical protein